MIIKCDNCGKEFNKSPREIKKNKRSFCCNTCKNSFFKKKKSLVKCLNCKEVFEASETEVRRKGRKFCGNSCAATYNNKVKPKRKFQGKCAECGVAITSSATYCNVHKNNAYEKIWKKRKEEITQTGKVNFGLQENATRRLAKRYLLEVQGHKCEICGLYEWRGQPIPLILDHIDGHSDNNDLKNLRLVCGNCNMQLPTFAGKNLGNGRKYKREKYHKDKQELVELKKCGVIHYKK
jgi:hypothetical protein